MYCQNSPFNNWHNNIVVFVQCLRDDVNRKLKENIASREEPTIAQNLSPFRGTSCKLLVVPDLKEVLN